MITKTFNKNSNNYFCCCYYLKNRKKVQEVSKMNTQQVKTVNAEFLTTLGFPKATAQQIIRQTKLNMVQQGYIIYNNRRLGNVPIKAVEEILGFKLLNE